jgi:3-oxoacyl-[acyl-carrier protein] reductase
MKKKLEGKVALVTGASKGIGASIAEQLSEEGASVVVNYSTSKEGADRIVQKITQKGGKAIALQASMTEPKDIDRLFSETKKAFGKLDILINNAGAYEFQPLEQITPEHFHKLFDLNVLGLLLACRAALHYFSASGGSIVNISSLVSTSHVPNSAVYSATKGAVDAATRVLASELGPRKIRVNSINPGLVQTEGTQSKGFLEGDLRKEVETNTPLGRIGLPKDIAPAVVFLASDDASWITGESLVIAGGYH